MMATTPLDPRCMCNLMLDEADRLEIDTSNLALQKLLYFAHSVYVIECKTPLVNGYFEAWTYGPVHPDAYSAFKAAGDKPIRFRAQRRDPLTGQTSDLQPPKTQIVHNLARRIMSSYGRMTAGRLVEIAHAPFAPWHFVVDSARHNMALGLRISDNIIVERFKYHKVSVGLSPRNGEPSEDTPFTGDRSG